MSRVGKKPVVVPSGVTAAVEGQTVKMKGPKGQLQFVVHDDVEVKFENGEVKVAPRFETKRARSLYGTARAQVANLVEGVTKGFEKKLEITGVGYRAALQEEPATRARLQPRRGVCDPGRHRHHRAEADRDRDRRQRFAARRPGRRRDPQLSSAGTVQGQGRALRR